MSKDQILAAYLNRVYYGNDAYGAEAAARTYFSRPASRLSLPQAALLAGLPQAPSAYDPLARPDGCPRPAERGAGGDALHSAHLVAAVPDLERGSAAARAGRPLSPHPSVAVRSYVESRLERSLPERRLEGGGLTIHTTVDPGLERVANHVLRARLPSSSDPAAALVAIDPRTGAIRAMAARTPGRRLVFDLPAQARREAGSAFKPFTLVAALEQHISLDSVWDGPPSLVIPDRRCLNGVNLPWQVHNYADESAGRCASSTRSRTPSTPSSPSWSSTWAPRTSSPSPIGWASRRRSKPVCSITLGSQAVTPLEMADGYATLAARGVHHAPSHRARP